MHTYMGDANVGQMLVEFPWSIWDSVQGPPISIVAAGFVSGKQLKATKMVMQPRKILGFFIIEAPKTEYEPLQIWVECVKCVGVLDEPTVKNMKVTRENRP